ncbi:MAG: acyltransferase domain-containing protein, partial [Planctomycetaceae bacterium]|nr:acyltransferase domain-containing protein [Planctomycetaceae bacterium]
VEVILEALERGAEPGEVHLLFAGGIHDARSAAAVSALAAPLAARGVRVGVLIGTAYLFTAEAVATGAIVAGFQSEALRCAATVLLETGPGHEVRVCPTPFTRVFARERQRLLDEGRPAEEVRAALEGLNAGRLRVAAKGIDRSLGAGSPLVSVAEADQVERGLYMVGQAATLRDRVTTIAALHREIAEGGPAWLERVAEAVARPKLEPDVPARPSDVAIVGMSAIVPGAADVRTFWENTLRGVDAIVEVPADRWDWRLYYDPDPKAADKIVSKWGGFVPDIPFDPLRYGMPPSSLPSIEPMHLLTLEAVRAALDDAGYRDRPFPRARTAVVLGAGGGAAQLAMGYAFRSYLPMLDTVAPGAGREALEHCGARLPDWTEDSFAGILLNVAAGRVANRFDLGGANYTVDAACGSSLAAAALAVRELESGAADMVILGGADTVQNPFTYLAFSKTQAFSPRGRCRPFDASADGIVISEAVAVVVLKRLADAERDGDRIYAVIKGLGASSDGRAKGLTAPRTEGQVRALRRAYAKAGVAPATVGYVEAHGTGTAAGDLAEVEALTEVFAGDGAPRNRCALGSIKSLIGHTKCAAGLAGLINAALALHHAVLPPTIGVVEPNPRANLEESPFHINVRARPWLHADGDSPRRAGVSAFGFGGTNFHAVLEAYTWTPGEPPAPVRDWPAELLAWRAPDRGLLLEGVDRLLRALDGGSRPALRDLSRTLLDSLDASQPAALAVVVSSLDDLRGKLDRARRALAGDASAYHDPKGIDFAERSDPAGRRVAFLFPGQGAQRPEMLGELAVAFPEVRRAFEAIDTALRTLGRPVIGPKVFPPPGFDEGERARQGAALADPEVAQPALAAASVGLLRLLESLGVRPEVFAGHSYGELVALHAAGAFSVEALAELSEARGRFLKAAVGDEPGAMAALVVGPERVAAILDGLEGVAAVNWNGPSQTVISGTRAAVAEAVERARRVGVRGRVLPVACAFHSPLVAGAREPLATLASLIGMKPPRLPIFSNVTAAPYPAEVEAIAAQLGDHLTRPVRFAEMVEAMHADGARIFVEVGPGAALTGMVGSILGDRPHLAVACEPPGQRGLPGLLMTLGRLLVAGVPLRLDRLTAGRAARRLDPTRFTAEPDAEPLPPSAWLVNGSRARPASGPEPARLGVGPALPAPGPALSRNGTAHAPHKNGTVLPELGARPITSAASGPSDGVERAFVEFQKTMQAFLEVQRTAMLTLLTGQGAPDLPSRPLPIEGEPDLLRRAPAAPPARVEPAPPKPVSAPERLGREELAARLLAIVRERTGYPAEMLRLDLDLEADLGIDSIKRVEILGSLRDALPAPAFDNDSEMMDQLARTRTLGAIVDRVGRALESSRGADGFAAEPAAPHSKSRGPVRRLVLEAVEAPLSRPSRGTGLMPKGLVLVTDDRRGVARAVAADLRAQGHPVVLVGHAADSPAEHAPEGEWADL